MRSAWWIVVAFAALLLATGQTTAGEKLPDGKTLFVEHCKVCHGPDSEHGEYTPMTLIQEQWERFFKEKLVPSHSELADPSHSDKKFLEVVTPEVLEKIKKFSIDHAADSEHPMTCG